MPGYWNKPEATAETFADGWLHSGDLARIDDEGLIYIVDRLKDMINRGGENVYCVEVENALAAAPGRLRGRRGRRARRDDGREGRRRARADAGPEFDVEAVLAYARERNSPTSRCPQYVVRPVGPAPAQPGRQGAQARLREDVDWAAAFRR